MRLGAFKVWRKESDTKKTYIGEFYPPGLQACFWWYDLAALGFEPGEYLVLIPYSVRELYALPKWQNIKLLPEPETLQRG